MSWSSLKAASKALTGRHARSSLKARLSSGVVPHHLLLSKRPLSDSSPRIIMKPKQFFIVPVLIAASCLGLSGTRATAQGQSILPQGTFEQPGINGKPSGWSIQTPEGTTLAGDAKNHWVQLRDTAVMMHFLKLSPEWTKLTV